MLYAPLRRRVEAQRLIENCIEILQGADRIIADVTLKICTQWVILLI